MPVHLFARVELKEGALKLLRPDAKWFDTHLGKKAGDAHYVKHYAEGEQDWLYLTDSTRQVRAFLRKCVKHPEAFAGDMVFTKASDSQELPPAPPPADTGKK